MPELQEAIVGRFGNHHAFLLARVLGRIDQASANIATLDHRIEAELAPFAAAADQLDEITRVGWAA
jgi:transposase